MTALFAALAGCFLLIAFAYWWLLCEAEKRIVQLQQMLDECRRAEQRYATALMKARTP